MRRELAQAPPLPPKSNHPRRHGSDEGRWEKRKSPLPATAPDVLLRPSTLARRQKGQRGRNGRHECPRYMAQAPSIQPYRDKYFLDKLCSFGIPLSHWATRRTATPLAMARHSRRAKTRTLRKACRCGRIRECRWRATRAEAEDALVRLGLDGETVAMALGLERFGRDILTILHDL